MSKHLVYKGVRIKKIPWFLWFLFNPRKRNGMASSSQIYVSQKVYNDLRTKNPDTFCIAILEHEMTHLKRKRQFGKWRYGLKFWLSGKFRLQEELMADKAMMLYLRRKRLSFPIKKRAKKLSSKLYLWMISYPEAKRRLTRMWKTFEIP